MFQGILGERGMRTSEKATDSPRSTLPSRPRIYALRICLPTLDASAIFMRFTDAKVQKEEKEEKHGVEGSSPF